jgi:hypothetical protein
MATGTATGAAGAWIETGEPATGLAGVALPIAAGALAGAASGRSALRDWLITVQRAPAGFLLT